MSKWKMVKLGDVCKFINGDRGKNYPSGKDIVENGIPFINAGHLVNNEISFSSMNYITEDKYNQLGSGKIQKGDFLYCLRGSLGKHAIVENLEKGAVASSLVILRPTNIDVHYLSYCMDSPSISTQLQQANNGSSQPNLSANSVKQYIVPLPPLEEQKRIADILDKASNLIDLRKQQLEKMDLLIKSKFIDMFGDPVTNPKGWEVKCLKDTALGKLAYGSGASATEYDFNVRYIRITDINEKGSLNDIKVSPNEISDGYLLSEGDILFARSGATVGKTFRYSKKYGKCIYAGYLIRLVPNQKIVLPDYIYYFSRTDYYLSFIQQNMKTVAQPNINAQQYGELQIPIPQLSLQNQFAVFAEQVEKQKAVMQQSLEKMEMNYKALMQEYFG